MPVEIEKKFLLKYLPAHLLSEPVPICQGYLVKNKDKVIRIRLYGDQAFITIKSQSINCRRNEYEYPVPVAEAKEMISLFCVSACIEKDRYHVHHKGFEWVIDRFKGANHGLIVAEIELEAIDQAFEIPEWIGKEVSHDPRYYNANLIDHPFSDWQR